MLAAAALGGCKSKSKNDAAGRAGDSSATTPADTTRPTAPAAEPPAEAAAMVEYDLTPADPSWAGWVASGATGAKVMQHGSKAARIAGGGRDGFDLSWAPKKLELAEYKESLKKGEAASGGKLKITFVKDEPGALEWTQEGYGTTTHSFMMHMTADGKDVTCSNNAMVGIRSEGALLQHKNACGTLKKKP